MINDTQKNIKTNTVNKRKSYCNVTIHDNLPDPDDNLISYYYQNVGGLNLQDETMNIDDLFLLTIDHEFYLLAVSEINLDTTKHHNR